MLAKLALIEMKRRRQAAAQPDGGRGPQTAAAGEDGPEQAAYAAYKCAAGPGPFRSQPRGADPAMCSRARGLSQSEAPPRNLKKGQSGRPRLCASCADHQ